MLCSAEVQSQGGLQQECHSEERIVNSMSITSVSLSALPKFLELQGFLSLRQDLDTGNGGYFRKEGFAIVG